MHVARDKSPEVQRPAPDLQLLDVRAVARLMDCHRSTIWKRVSAGKLPAPIRIAGLTRWKLADIQAAIEAAEREAA